MALDASVGTSTANSYVTVLEADSYFVDRLHSDTWTGFTNKESALITSSQMLDWYFRWKGSKSTVNQSMGFPRIGVVLRDGTIVDNTIIPSEVKIATFELALSSLSEDRTDDNPLFGLEQVKISSLMAKADGLSRKTVKEAIPERVKQILFDLYTRGGVSVIRLNRA